MANTKINWTSKVWNPTTGCNKISAGCANCYAEIMHRRLMAMQPEKYSRPFLDDAKISFFMKQIDKIQEIPNDLEIKEYPEKIKINRNV